MKVQWRTGYILGLAGLVILLFRFATDIGLILFISLLLALLLRPVKLRLARRFSAGLAAFLALLLFVGVASLFVTWILDQLLPGLKQFAANVPDLVNPEKITLWIISLNLPPELLDYANRLMDNARDFVINAVQSSLMPAIQALSSIVELIGIPFITFYLLRDGRLLKDLAVAFVPPAERAGLLDFFDAVAEVLGGYIKGQVAVCLVSGVSVFLFFLVTGMPFAPIFAALSAVGELIPVIGPLSVSVFAVLFAATISTQAAIQVAVFYFIMFKLSNAIVYPNLIGKAIRIHPAIIMVGLLLFGSLFGALGMILAVPVLGVGRVALERILPRYEKLGKEETGE